jgi:hypothetical protein
MYFTVNILLLNAYTVDMQKAICWYWPSNLTSPNIIINFYTFSFVDSFLLPFNIVWKRPNLTYIYLTLPT